MCGCLDTEQLSRIYGQIWDRPGPRWEYGQNDIAVCRTKSAESREPSFLESFKCSSEVNS